MITVLAGGTGSVKLVRGLASKTKDLVVISNVGDNIWLHGLYVCPDIDTIIYGLAGLLDEQQGWGIKNDTFNLLDQIKSLGSPAWFQLGDRDLATHVLRTEMIKNGKSLSHVTDFIRKKYGISAKIIPATNDPVTTKVFTDSEEMHLQEFWVKHRARPRVRAIKFEGAESARAHPQAIDAIRRSEMIVVAPANPVSSIGPIVGVAGLKKELELQRKKTVAVSPIIGDNAISGPAIKYMKALKLENSPAGVAKYYSEFVSKFVISESDVKFAPRIKELDMEVFKTNIMMRNRQEERRLAGYLVKLY